MKKLHIMVLKSFLGPLFMTFFIAVFILLMQFLWLYIDDFIGKGLSFGLMLELMFYTSWTLVPLALPISVLLSSLMTMGNLGEHYELAAAKTSGISLWKTIQPLVVTAFLLSGIAFFFSNYLYPLANLKHQSLLFDVRQKKLAFNLEEGSFYHDIDNYVIRVDSKGLDNASIYGVMIYDHSDHNGLTKVTIADRGLISMSPDEKSVVFELHDGCNYEEGSNRNSDQSGTSMQRLFFETQIVQFSLESFQLDRSNEDVFKSNYSMQNISQLAYSVDSINRSIDQRKEETKHILLDKCSLFALSDSVAWLKNRAEALPPLLVAAADSSKNELIPTSHFLEQTPIKNREMLINSALSMVRNQKQTLEFYSREVRYLEDNRRKHEVAWHEKFTLSFACLVMFFIGAPLGAIIRKGGLGFSMVISTVLFIIFYVMNMIGKEYAVAGEMQVWSGMWISSFLFLPLGIFFTIKAANDAPLLDAEVWGKNLNSLKHKWLNRKSNRV